jgi:hypothetical protein
LAYTKNDRLETNYALNWKNAAETFEMLEVAFVEQTVGRAQFFEYFFNLGGIKFSIFICSISHSLTAIVKIMAKHVER